MFVLVNAFYEVACYARIKRAIAFICHTIGRLEDLDCHAPQKTQGSQ